MGPLGAPELMMLIPFALVAIFVWLVYSKSREKVSKRAEVQKEIIGKFSTSAEMREFLNSEEGRALFRNLNSEDGRKSGSARDRAIARIGLGIVLTIVGGGISILAHYSDQPQIMAANGPPPAAVFLEMPPGMGFLSAPVFFIGIGMLISALVTWKLSSQKDSKS